MMPDTGPFRFISDLWGRFSYQYYSAQLVLFVPSFLHRFSASRFHTKHHVLNLPVLSASTDAHAPGCVDRSLCRAADWRTDTTSDLQLILLLNVLLVLMGSIAKRALVDPLEGEHDSAWINIYDVSSHALRGFC